jgi:hypothetical protein
MRQRRWVPFLAAFGVFLLLTVAHTWPLASNPAHLSRNDNSDTLLNTWTIAWVAHQLPRHPRHLFDANIFYPDRATLAYSEAMIVQGVMAMPVLRAGGSPVLAYNLVLLAGFVLTGWAFCVLLYRWTGSWAAGYVGGSLAAFNAHVFGRLPHLQTQHVEFVALMLFALDRLLVSRRVRDALLLGAAFALQGLTSVYLLVFTTWMMIFAVAARAREWLRREPAKMVALLTVAGGLAAALMAPYVAGYWTLHRITGLERTVGEVRQYAGTWTSYLITGARFHYALWSHRFFGRVISSNFPGVAALVLAALALRFAETRADARVQMCLAAAAGCLAVSMLPHAPFYPWLHRAVPLFHAVRVPAHLGQIVLLMIAVLAGFGVAGLARRLPPGRTWGVVAVLLVAVVNAEAWSAPLELTPFTEIPPIYEVLAGEKDAVVAELPFYPPTVFFANGVYMLNSTKHWRPMLNGYSGFRPDEYDREYEAFHTFPGDSALAALHQHGVTHIVVHTDQLDPEHLVNLDHLAAMQLVATDGTIRIYRLRPE